ncbi:hypothetical protein [Frankia sp. KB5]|nr:hypothetical protein [Frankia sp. KB5]
MTEAFITLVLVIGAYWIGRLWQWVVDARRALGTSPHKNKNEK